MVGGGRSGVEPDRPPFDRCRMTALLLALVTIAAAALALHALWRAGRRELMGGRR